MFKDFFLKKMLDSQLKNVPEEQRQKVIEMISQNPDFFNKIAEEVKKEVDAGKNQMSATMEVVQRHKSELEGLLK